MSFDQYTGAFLNGNLKEDASRADCEIEFLKLKKLIIENKIIVAKRGTKAFGKLNILPLFCEIFSEKFSYYLEQFPTIKKGLCDVGLTDNLTEMLTDKFMCFDFAELIYESYNFHSSKLDQEVWTTQNVEDEKQWKKAVEFLHLLYEITHYFSKGQILDGGVDFDHHHRVHNRRKQIDWCAYCFRRVKSIGEQRPLQVLANLHDQRFPEKKSRKTVQLLCKRHESSKENDTFYRSARKKAKSLSEKDRQYIDQIHSERRLYEVLNFNKPVDYKMTAEQWEISKSKWLGYLNELCPFTDLSDINSWEKFTIRFHLLLDNELEDTQIPSFIEDIYIEAKIWDELQKNYYTIDKRRKKII